MCNLPWRAVWFAAVSLLAFRTITGYPVRAIRPIVSCAPSGPVEMNGTEIAARAALNGYTLCTAGMTFMTATVLNLKL